MAETHTTTVRDLRRSNQSRTLWELYLHGPLTYQQLATSIGVSVATVSNVMGQLLRQGAVAEVGVEDSNGGRPRGVFHINPGYANVIGVDVGETAIMVELFDLRMRVLASHHSVTSHSRLDPAEVVDQVVEGIEAVLSQSGRTEEQILGVGVGVPGLVEHGADGEAVVFDQSIGWGTVAIERMLRERTSLSLTVDNGANTLGQAERWFGAARGGSNSIIVLLGAGVGASIISRAGRYGGAASLPAEFGHTTVVAGGRRCVCGALGCLEAYAGADAVVARYDELSGRRQAVDPREVEERLVAILAAGPTDEHAAQVIDEFYRYLGVGLGNLVNLFTPDRIVIGGWVGHVIGASSLERLRSEVAANALVRPMARLQLVLAQLGTDAVAMGAATLPVAAFLRSGGASAETVAPRRRLNVEA
ncbi:ROK family transcriptional regulator [Rathayibacter sp. YIM 133350]|uniref:ROK family transcriptional regulator n=1 Tax=Rathayibacter sp. YIM 133350 TaxID=3131992 RepID=UPI00307E8569